MSNSEFVPNRSTHRKAIALFFFTAGITFASWASRIPDIKHKFHLTDAGLGSLLLALPIGSLVSLPIAGWLVATISSRKTLLLAGILYPVALIMLALAPSVWVLTGCLFCFGLFGNMFNISVNTQAIAVEYLYEKPIMASFHGVWSLAGFAGAAVGAAFISYNTAPIIHFIVVTILSVLAVVVLIKNTLPTDVQRSAQPIFAIPDAALLKLGFIAFCCMACEGTLFDWSGVYFQTIVQVPKAYTALGYVAFMGAMATGRFIGDGITAKVGKKTMLQASGITISVGLLLAVIFPVISMATFGFLLVGFGVSSVVPLVYSAAGKSTTLSPSMALAAVSSIGFLGFLMGPPVIGFIAQAASLRWSFTLIAALGFCTTLIVSKLGID